MDPIAKDGPEDFADLEIPNIPLATELTGGAKTLLQVKISVANSITAVQILKTEAVIVQVFDHFSPKYTVIVRVLSN